MQNKVEQFGENGKVGRDRSLLFLWIMNFVPMFRSDCSVTCGGGHSIRKRKCQRSADVDDQQAPCFGAAAPNFKEYTQQTKMCNVAGCPRKY